MSSRARHWGPAKRDKALAFAAAAEARRKARIARSRGIVPGKTRSTGYYGRFHGKNAEQKFFDNNSLNATAVSNTGVFLSSSVNLVPTGTGESEKIGRKLTIKSIFWRYSVELPAVSAAAIDGNDDSVRLIVYLDKQANGAAATVTEILEAASIHSFNNLENSQRFTIMKDELIDIQRGALTNDGSSSFFQPFSSKNMKWYKKCNIPIEFGSNAAPTIADIKSNNIGVLAISRAAACDINSRLRIRFSDN